MIHRFQLLETTVRREKLLETLVEASRHVRADMEIPSLHQLMVQQAAEVAGCRVGGLYLNRPYLGQLDRAAAFGIPEHWITEYLSHQEGFLGQVARDGKALIHPNPGKDDFFIGLALEVVAVVPCVNGAGEVEAVLFVGDSSRAPFSRTDIEILKAFASQATIALHTARLMGQEQLYLSQIAVLERIGRYVQETERLDRILHAVLTGVTANYGLGLNRAVLLLIDETGEQLVGELGIGEIEESKARSSWRSDEEQGFNDFERYLEQLENDAIEFTAVGRKIKSFRLPAGDAGLFSEVLTERAFRQISLQDFEGVPKPFREVFRVTTPLAVAPLMTKGQAIGLVVADNKFTQRPIGREIQEALMAFAATAAVAIENKRLFEQTRSSADRLTDFYRMSSELIAFRDPQNILNRIVDQTVEVSGASWVSILLIDRVGRIRNPVRSGPHVSESPKGPLYIRPEGISMKVMKEGRALFYKNVEREQDAGIPPNRTLKERGVKAAICLPLSLPGKQIGVMWIHYTEPRPFPESEVAALQLYVNQAATAYDSARRLEKLENLRIVFEDLAEAEDTKSVLRQIVEGAQRVLKADDVVFWAFEKTTNTFMPEDSAYAGKHQEAWGEFQKKGPLPGGTATRVMSQGWLFVEDIQGLKKGQEVGPNTREFLTAIGGRGFQGVALKVGREKLGVLYAIYSDPCHSGDDERDTAQAFANHAALALKKAKLFQQVQRAREAADVVARVTLMEDHGNALVSIASEIRAAMDCSLVVLFKCDQDARELIQPTTISGDLLPYEEGTDRPLVFVMLEHDGPYVVLNAEKDPHFGPSPFTQSQEIKACVALPLKAAGRKVGVLFINYRHHHRFTAEEVATMELFANQAAVAVHNAHLFTELSTKLAQQEVLAGLSKELLEVSTVKETLSRAVEYAARFFNTEFSNIVLPDREGRLVFRAAVGWEPGLVDTRVLEPGTGSQTGYTVETKTPVAVHDYKSVQEFTVPPLVPAMGIQSGLSAPMFREGKVIGAMLVHTTRHRRFSDEDKLLMGLIADQTALALERAQQYEKSQRQTAYLTALNEANKALTTSFGLERGQILERIIQPTMTKMVGIEGPSAILGTILLFNERSKELFLESVYPSTKRASVVEMMKDHWNIDEIRSITGRAIKKREPQLVPYVDDDPDYRRGDADTKSELAVPLLDREFGRVLGVLNAESDKPNAFDGEDIRALETLAELAVIAIQNARLVEEKKTQTSLAWWGLKKGVGAHELNGRIGTLRAKIFNRREELGDFFEEIDYDLSTLCPDRPSSEIEEKVDSVLVDDDILLVYHSRFQSSRPTDAHQLGVSRGLGSAARIRVNVEKLFQVLDILVNNAIQAKAKRVVLGSRAVPGLTSQIEIYVEDDGRGVPESFRGQLLRKPIQGSKGFGLGLLIAQAVVRDYNGEMHWTPRSPQGTVLAISLPLDANPGEF